ncbi:proenkephalin-A [Megalops cyprinoides]|uniref:proenkephalin-A n=1 Tax=Megalops cyprinoides TaxID=118141 RepID=UPI001863EF45|nr:proenkephalin-A [Megalops cyprinoides]
MKTALWTLLLFCLCVPGRSDCQNDCLSCSQQLHKDQAFSMLVCLVECEGNAAPTPTWELCRQAAEQVQLTSFPLGGTMLKREEEAVAAMLPADQGNRGLLYSGALQQFDNVARALGIDELGRDSRTAQLSAAYRSRQGGSEEEEEEGEEEEGNSVMDGQENGAALNLTKRFGGFLKGKYGYRKLMDPGRSLQKRYGGFIGVRKSARKWNNQKRFSEFLKQYLGMTARASEFNSVSADITRQNEV